MYLQSRNGKPLSRYFPELKFPEGRYILDGEIVIFGDDGVQLFDALGQRIHPAKTRIDMLAEQIPSRFIAFDVLARDDEVLSTCPNESAARCSKRSSSSPSTSRPTPKMVAEAEPWLRAPRASSRRSSTRRTVRASARHGEDQAGPHDGRRRAGLAAGQGAGTVGSLILASTPKAASCGAVGHTSGFKAAEKRSLVDKLAPYETGERGMGDPSRWANDREGEWRSVQPQAVVEVTFDHVSDGRIRHGAKIQRWREDKDLGECSITQLDQ